MRKKLTWIKICSAFTILGVMGSMNFSYATTTTEINNQKKEVNSKIDETKKDLENVKDEKSTTDQKVETLASQISSYEKQIQDVDAEMTKINEDIKEAQNEIDKLKQEREKKQGILDERLVALYEAGQTSFLDFILGSESLVDFISKYTLAQEVTSYDSELIEGIDKDTKEIEVQQKELNSKVTELESKKESKQSMTKQLAVLKNQEQTKSKELGQKQEELEGNIEKFEQEAKKLDSKEKELEKALQKKFEEERKKKEEEEKRKQEEANKNNNSSNNGNGSSNNNSSGGSSNNSGGNSKPSSKGYIRPISSKYPITTGLYYSSGKYHGAVDFSGAGISGQPVYAVADGIVMFAGWGGADSYGNYVKIKHFDGTYTLYAHASSLAVSYGQQVKQGQTIMYVGSTGNSTGPHLHFEVRTGSGGYNNRVDPRPYLP